MARTNPTSMPKRYLHARNIGTCHVKEEINIFENDKEQIKERNSKELVKERNGTEKEPVRADASFAAEEFSERPLNWIWEHYMHIRIK